MQICNADSLVLLSLRFDGLMKQTSLLF